MDRRALFGKSKAELVMTRVGEVMAACYLLLLLPVLPVLAAYLAVQRLISLVVGETDRTGQYQPGIEA